MEIQTQKMKICRLCLENESVDGFLVEIFSSMINEKGKTTLVEKIKKLFGLNIISNDGLPSMVCHKCLVLTENCAEFREKCLKNNEKLRLIFKVEETQEAEELALENHHETDEEEEVISLNPNELYVSSDESDLERQVQEQTVVEPISTQTVSSKVSLPPVSQVNKDRKEIFHCRYCDVVFSETLACSEHEKNTHHSLYPYECVVCSFKTDQHPSLIYHIKQSHNMEKPFLCTQCTKTFIRRSDLRKHTFVHAGIRLFSCEVCKKSFTRNTNLTKHKRTHSEKSKIWNSEIKHLIGIKTFSCKHCNQSFVKREQLDLHQKTHYNQPVEIVDQFRSMPHASINTLAPMNFYTENLSLKVDQSISSELFEPKILPYSKSFVCGFCGTSFNKKNEHDRHVVKIHTKTKIFSCDTCLKTFNRKDKLMRHKKAHLASPTFNCSLCSSIFKRQHLLENHMKHHIENGENLETDQQPPYTSLDHFMNEPINLSSDNMIPESPTSLMNLRNLSDEKSNGRQMNVFKKEPVVIQKSADTAQLSSIETKKNNQVFSEPENHENNDITLSMSSRIAALEKLEPSRDLPKEILNND